MIARASGRKGNTPFSSTKSDKATKYCPRQLSLKKTNKSNLSCEGVNPMSVIEIHNNILNMELNILTYRGTNQ